MQLLGCDRLAVFLSGDGHLPCTARAERTASFIHAVAFVGELGGCSHCRHTHRRHPSHIKRDRNLSSSGGSSICTCEFHSKDVAALLRWIWIGDEVDICLCSGGCIRCWRVPSGTRWRWHKGTCGGL